MNMGGGGGGGGGGGFSFDLGMTQAMASKKASKSMTESLELAMYLYEMEKRRQIEAYKPWTETGQEAARTLWEKIQGGPGEYKESPYYNFLLEEGTKGLERGAAARGRQFSGAQAKSLTKYGENLASMDYNTWLTNWYRSLVPIESVSQTGLGAETALSGGQMQMTSAIANLVQSMGAVNAAQWMNLGNIMSSNQKQMGGMITSGIGNMFGGGGMGGAGINSLTTPSQGASGYNALYGPQGINPYFGF